MKTAFLFALFITAQAFAATPAEKAIVQAMANIDKQPNHAPYYNNLAMAYARRARETSDTAFYSKAEETLTKSFAIEPDNFEGLKTQAWLQLGRHEFAKARETALKLNKISPDDISVYGYLVDANAELGNYEEAIGAAQWMLDLRPGNVAGLVRAAYLRELHGNLPGALELMQMAYDSEALSETEDRAWLLTQMAHLELLSGDVAKAESYSQDALAAFPDYHYALAALAQVRTAQARYPEAAALLVKRYQQAPHAENLYALAEAQERAGDKEAASESFRKFEQESVTESMLADNSNRELIFYYLDHAHAPAKAMEIAKRELARRHDVFTLDAYAWTLAVGGDYAAAHEYIEKALSIGVKDPKILAHAQFIAEHARV
jgi:tetratricopeptide (TPR) repeat protein